MNTSSTQTLCEPETDLIARLQRGDGLAFEELVREHGARMLIVARRLLRCDHSAADAIQDAFLSAFKSIGSFSGESRLSTWLHRIVVNSCLMRLRTESRRPAASLEAHLPRFDSTSHQVQPVPRWSDDAMERVELSETRRIVREQIDELPEPYRTVLLLRDIDEFDTAETAKLLHCTTANVKTRLHRARQALRARLESRFSSHAAPD